MLWLIVVIFAYFLLAAVHIVDKYLLGKRIPSPKLYAFYVGVFGILVLGLAPFGYLKIPALPILGLALIAGVFHILAIFFLFKGLKLFEASRIIPAVGGFLPLFTFGFTFLFPEGKRILNLTEIIAFFLLLSGTILITSSKRKIFSSKSIKIAALSAFLFALFFILIKFVYLAHPFLSSMIWSRVGAFLMALLFLLSTEVREDLFKGPKFFQRKTWLIVIPNEGAAAGAFLLQNWAVALAPFAYLGTINALEGIKYVFLLILAILLSWKFPQILKEEISRKTLFQKIIAILLISGGVAILSLI